MSIIDTAVPVHVYRRNEIFPLALCFVQKVAASVNGSVAPRDDGAEVLFLCKDAIGLSFWVTREGQPPAHVVVNLDKNNLLFEVPELVDLWLWKHVDQTWDELRAMLAGEDISQYARSLAREYPQGLGAPVRGLN